MMRHLIILFSLLGLFSTQLFATHPIISNDLPPNDLCEDAIELYCGQTLNGNTVDANWNGPSPPVPEVWYKVVGNDKAYDIEVCGAANFSPTLTVYSGNCDALEFIFIRKELETGESCDRVDFWAESGETYYIRVSANQNVPEEEQIGEFEIRIDCPRCDITDIILSEPPRGATNPYCLTETGTFGVAIDVIGQGMPSINDRYKFVFDGQSYDNITSGSYSPHLVKLFINGIPDSDAPSSPKDLFLRVFDGCTWTERDFISPQDCPEGEVEECDITSISVAAGPTCNGDGTYNISFLVEGEDLGAEGGGVKLVIDHIEGYISGINTIDADTWIVMAQNVPSDGERDIEVFFRAAEGCTYTARALYNELDCNVNRIGRTPSPQFEIYPNPTNDILYIKTANLEDPEIFIFNQMSQLVYQSSIEADQEVALNLRKLPVGFYTIRLKAANHLQSRKFVHTH